MRHLLILVVHAAALLAAGCKSQSGASADAPAASETSTESTESAAAAQAMVASMPSADARLHQEVLLHAALYRAAYETNVGDFTNHFVLQPVEEADPPDIGADPEQFRLRVLAKLADLNVPIAWVAETWQNHDVDYFPGTSERATRLRIKILQRDENHATVTGEVGDWTADIGSSRQGVTATWDGVKWNVQRDRVRLVVTLPVGKGCHALAR